MERGKRPRPVLSCNVAMFTGRRAHLDPSRRGAPQGAPPSRPAQRRRDASGRPGPAPWGNFRFSAPNVARGVLKAPRPIAVAGAIDFAPPGGQCRRTVGGRPVPAGTLAAMPTASRGAAGCCCCCCCCCCWCCWGRSGAGSSSGRYGSATAPCSLPARAILCVWRRGAAQRAPRARCCRGLLSAQLTHMLTAGELARQSSGLSCGIGRLVASRRHNCA